MPLQLISAAGIKAVPRLRLPARTVGLRLTDAAGRRVAAVPITAFVLGGGGGFPAGPIGRWPMPSELRLATDSSGEVWLPDFVLGPEAGANRLLVQSDHAHQEVLVIGSYEGAELVADDPPSGQL